MQRIINPILLFSPFLLNEATILPKDVTEIDIEVAVLILRSGCSGHVQIAQG